MDKTIQKTMTNCPTCQKQIQYDQNNPYRPFCSKRCKLIDLGEWFDEKNVIE